MPFASAIADESNTPIRPSQEINFARAELGKRLYFGPRLSKSGFIPCDSRHNLSMGGTDNLKTLNAAICLLHLKDRSCPTSIIQTIALYGKVRVGWSC